MTTLFNKTREFVRESFDNDEAQMRHFDRTVYWLKRLNAATGGPPSRLDEAFLISAIAHDIERAFREDKSGFDNRGSFKDEKWLLMHSNKGAEILEKFLKEQGAKEGIIERVKHLVLGHETGGDEEQNLLKDADSLSFVENNAPIFFSRIDGLGYDRVKEKFDWMYNRISSAKAKELAKPFYDKIVLELGEYK